MGRWWREPVLHFAALGAAVFAIDAALAGDPPDRVVVRVDLEDRQGWIEEEILVREARALGLDDADPVVRRRLAQKMRFVLADSVTVPEPTPEALQAWLGAHQRAFERPERVAFEQLFLGDQPLDDAAADPEGHALAFPLDRKQGPQTLERVATRFGPDFAEGLAAAPAGAWDRPDSVELRLAPGPRRSADRSRGPATRRDRGRGGGRVDGRAQAGGRAPRLRGPGGPLRGGREVILGLLAALAGAHQLRPAVVLLQERADASWDVRVGDPLADTEVALPCPGEALGRGRWRMRCPDGLAGTLALPGLRTAGVDAVVRVQEADGGSRSAVLHANRTALALSAPPRASGYLRLGAEHIAAGADHLLFVLGLVMLTTAPRRLGALLAAVTAFTVAHSLTLAASALDVFSLASRPVEITVALSIVLLARELTHDRPTLARARPALVAFAFGLVHGLGFAGALREIGLPTDAVVPALLGFNVGVELGQLAFVAVALGPVLLLDRLDARWRAVAAYAMGAVAVAWVIQRLG